MYTSMYQNKNLEVSRNSSAESYVYIVAMVIFVDHFDLPLYISVFCYRQALRRKETCKQNRKKLFNVEENC